MLASTTSAQVETAGIHEPCYQLVFLNRSVNSQGLDEMKAATIRIDRSRESVMVPVAPNLIAAWRTPTLQSAGTSAGRNRERHRPYQVPAAMDRCLLAPASMSGVLIDRRTHAALGEGRLRCAAGIKAARGLRLVPLSTEAAGN